MSFNLMRPLCKFCNASGGKITLLTQFSILPFSCKITLGLINFVLYHLEILSVSPISIILDFVDVA